MAIERRLAKENLTFFDLTIFKINIKVVNRIYYLLVIFDFKRDKIYKTCKKSHEKA